MDTLDTQRNPLEVLAEQFAQRHRSGENPTIAEYTTKHPDLADQIEALFPSVILVEQLGSHHRQLTHGARRWTAPSLSSMQRLGDFRILREVGRGGMGVVYEAEQESLGRRVALKVLPRGAAEDQRQQQRFEREARAAARLHHNNIVPVFGVGRQDGWSYYVMQFIDGIPLDRWLRATDAAKRQTPEYVRRVAELGIQAAEALEYAHGQGVVHRDIKPSNLLVDGQNTVWITDFGVARLAEEDGLTRAGDFVGTLRYMAPEQIHGAPDSRSDVYSLGITLYELLAGQPAYGETSHLRLVQRIGEEDPVLLRRLQPRMPRDLETIVSKAISRASSQRYASAGEMAEDLRRFLADRPIRARRVSVAARLGRWCRRNRTVALLSALTSAAILAAMVVGWVGYLNTQQALTRAEKAVGRAEGNLELSLEALESVFRQTAGRDWLRSPLSDVEAEPFATSIPSEEQAALLERLLGFYERFAANNEESSRLQAETAKAYRRMGEIQTQLGRPDKAESALCRSVALYQALAGGESGPQRHAADLAAVYNDLGLALQGLGRYSEARTACFERALLVLGDDRSEASSLQRIRALNNLAWMTPAGGRRSGRSGGGAARKQRPAADAATQEAQRRHREALAIARDLVDRHPQDAEYRFLLAQTHRCLGQRLLAQDQKEEAVVEQEQALAILEKLVGEFPATAPYQAELAEACAAAGVAAASDKTRLAQARQLADELVRQYPRVPEYAALAARVRVREALVAVRAGRREEAAEAYRQTIEAFQKLAAQYPAVPRFAYMLGVHRHVFSEYLRNAGDGGRARSELEQAATTLEALLATHPNVPPAVRNYLNRIYQTLSKTLDELGERAAAATVREKISTRRASDVAPSGKQSQDTQEPE